jgi:hypothetical protein
MMFTDQPIPRGMERRVCVQTADPALQQLLTALLEAWEFQLEPEATDGVLLLAEEGCCEAQVWQQVLWLSHSTYAASNRVLLPLVIEDLYVNLERKFHSPPRRHLRLSLELPARVCCRGENHASRLTSLSDRGCRVTLPRELARDEAIELEFFMGDHPIRLEGHVIYSFNRAGATLGSTYDTGFLFVHQGENECLRLREFILASYLERVRSGVSPETFTRVFDHFRLSDHLRGLPLLESALN